MPYSSDAQRRWAHTDSAKKAGFPTDEFDKASKGKKLPERKMAEGGPVEDKTWIEKLGDYLESKHGAATSDKSEAEQALHVDDAPKVSSGTISGYADGGLVKKLKEMGDEMHENYIKGQGDNGNLRGLQDVLTGNSKPSIDTDDGQFLGEFNVNASSEPKKMADGGYATGDEDLPGFDVNTNTSSLKMGNTPASVTPQPPVPAFNPQAGLPPAPVAPIVSPKPSPILPQGFTPTANPAIGNASNYLNQQKAAYNQYGPEQQLALQQSLSQKYGGLQGKGAVALGGLADALMQGVARAGSSNVAERIQGAQQADIGRQTEALKEARTANIQNVEEGQKLDAQNPKSPLSQLTQASYKPLMSRLGYHDLSGMSAAQIETVAKVAAEFGGKEMEKLWQQARLAVEQNMKHQEMKLGAAKDIATEGIGTKLANMIPGTAGHAAQGQLEETAGVGEGPQPMFAQNAGGHMISSKDGGKTWTPIQ